MSPLDHDVTIRSQILKRKHRNNICTGSRLSGSSSQSRERRVYAVYIRDMPQSIDFPRNTPAWHCSLSLQHYHHRPLQRILADIHILHLLPVRLDLKRLRTLLMSVAASPFDSEITLKGLRMSPPWARPYYNYDKFPLRSRRTKGMAAIRPFPEIDAR
ncbi:hypothetical protein BU26DRAFT_516694 [Trematosphaeria pertusa]|uniref:Uncharacterized protein n=1 Tax=Trematosphaeria pertusa TaxID=390896 RepID=A0A6A6IP29_9PLEO|nr:uncharacterized protein BU26DRAFT_516694 [Trematosphaeria pertusa]KAF2251977.1 hypothetical protein BU26DRAFT_516694 [Trematosphaeria pertusa]